ncbi:hypothetical protein [Isoptericola dokdonensis]|uniref:Uncharacterized protein n=1 Tax=Isoptericola dokdonensis DS-3 TaxID=1300344 RepID=A0A168EBH1_9MICO|nr:hypothetical protein [Isoptericola dokdonensis]ANC29838.1 hypothetical protein I598_0247 [Isoptericola dokdonensis DS-3]
MSEVAAAERRSPFDGVPASEVVRDVVAAVALLVALPLPWDVLRRGSDLLWVVLATLLALVVVAAPYARRAGVLTGGWLRLAEPSTRRWGLAPYALVTVLYLVLDVVRSEPGAGAVGPGLALGLAGVTLAAAFPGTRPVVVVAGVVAVGAVLTPVLGLVDGAPWTSTLGSVLGAAFVLGVLWLTVRRFVRGDDASGTVLVGLGLVVALELAVLGGALEHRWLESVHGNRFGLFLLPVIAAAALPEMLERARRHDGEPQSETAARWVRVAVQALEIMIVSAGFVGLVALVQLVGGASAGNLVQLVLRLVVGVLVALVAFLARRALLRDPRAGHATAVGAACVVVVLGVVIIVARAGVGTASRVEELLLALGLPALVLAALLVPRAVRELVAAGSAASATSAPQGYPVQGEPVPGEPAAWQSAATGATAVVEPSATSPDRTTSGGYGDDHDVSGREHRASATSVPVQEVSAPGRQAPVQQAPVQQEQAQQPEAEHASAAAQPSRWRGTWAAGTDATQQLSPVTDEAARTQVQGMAPVRGTQPVARPDATQVLAPVVDEPGARWTAGHALDPATPLEDLAAIVQEAPHLRPHVAANPSTYPALLDWLGALGDPAVDAALRSRR